MSNGSELKSLGATALRAAGYIPLPRWWVKTEDMDHIEQIAARYRSEVNEIREDARK